MNLQLLLAFIAGQCWHVEPMRFDRFANALFSGEFLDEASLDAMVKDRDARPGVMDAAGFLRNVQRVPEKRHYRSGSVAIVQASGVLAKYASQVNGMSTPRGTSYEGLEFAMRDAADDPQASSILLLCDSPGGAAVGCDACAEVVREIDRTMKPVWAHASGLCCSAMYYIASQARHISATKDAEVGSIGTCAVLYDTSEKLKKSGVKVEVFASGEYKCLYADGLPVSDKFRAEVNKTIDHLFGLFKAGVAEGRPALGGMANVAKLADGRVYPAPEALALKLIDSIGGVTDDVAAMERLFGSGAAGKTTGVMPAAQGGLDMRTKGMTVTAMLLAAGAAAGATGEASAGIEKQASDGGNTSNGSNGSGGSNGAKQEPEKKATGTQAGQGESGGVRTLTHDQVRDIAKEAAAQGQAAERARVAAIRGIGLRMGADTRDSVRVAMDKAIEDANTTVDTFKSELLDIVAKDNTPLGSLHVGVNDSRQKDAARDVTAATVSRFVPGMESALRGNGPMAFKAAALATALGFANAAAACSAIDAANANGLMADFGFSSLARQSLARVGAHALLNQGDQAVILAAVQHTTGDFPTLLGNIAQKSLLAGYTMVPTTWQRWCKVDPAKNFLTRTKVRKSGLTLPSVIKEGERPKFVTFAEQYQTAGLRTEGLSLRLTREMLVNDDTGAFNDLVREMYESIAWGQEIEAFNSLLDTARKLKDGSALIRGSNTSTAAALSDLSLKGMFTKFYQRPGIDPDAATKKRPLGLSPRILLVSPGDMWLADQLANSAVQVGATANTTMANQLRGKFEPIVSELIEDGEYYLFNDPATGFAAVLMSLLNGNAAPTISPITNGSKLSVEWEVFCDYQSDPMDDRMVEYNAGA